TKIEYVVSRALVRGGELLSTYAPRWIMTPHKGYKYGNRKSSYFFIRWTYCWLAGRKTGARRGLWTDWQYYCWGDRGIFCRLAIASAGLFCGRWRDCLHR